MYAKSQGLDQKVSFNYFSLIFYKIMPFICVLTQNIFLKIFTWKLTVSYVLSMNARQIYQILTTWPLMCEVQFCRHFTNLL